VTKIVVAHCIRRIRPKAIFFHVSHHFRIELGRPIIMRSVHPAGNRDPPEVAPVWRSQP
jgi:hypothetical protein